MTNKVFGYSFLGCNIGDPVCVTSNRKRTVQKITKISKKLGDVLSVWTDDGHRWTKRGAAWGSSNDWKFSSRSGDTAQPILNLEAYALMIQEELEERTARIRKARAKSAFELVDLFATKQDIEEILVIRRRMVERQCAFYFGRFAQILYRGY